MASIQLKEVELQSPNPALYTAPFIFRIAVDVLEKLDEDMEVCFVWVTGPNALEDQKLAELFVGPLQQGTCEFIAEVPAPRWELIPDYDILADALLLVSLRYSDKEFLRVGYWVDVAYVNDTDNSVPPQTTSIERIARTLCNHPTVHTTTINWDNDVDALITGFEDGN